MNRWRVELRRSAEDDLVKLDKSVQRRVIEKLAWLEENFDGTPSLRLSWEYDDLQKLRVGDWRVVYKIDWKRNTITVVYIDHRSKVYRKRK